MDVFRRWYIIFSISFQFAAKKGCRKAVFFLMKYEKFIHIENINDFSKKEELYKMHEIIKKNSVPY